MLKLTILSAFVLVAVSADIVTYKDCGSVSGKITKVDITPCPSEPCQLKHNTNVTASIDFTSNVDSSTFKTVVHGIIAGVPVPFPLEEGKMSGIITTGASVTYTDNIFVQPTYPKISLLVKWEVQDSSGKDLICFVVPAQVSD